MPARSLDIGKSGGGGTGASRDAFNSRKQALTVNDFLSTSNPNASPSSTSRTAARSTYAPSASGVSGYAPSGEFYASSAGGGGGGGGSSAGGGGGTATDLTAPFTGFASRYAPGSAEMLFANPEVILRDTLRAQGRVADGGMYYMLQPQADAANALFLLGSGGTTDPNLSNNNAGINYINEFFRNQSTPGGEAVNFAQGMQALRNFAPGSTLDNLLNQTDPEAQIANYSSLANSLARSSLHPLAARAFSNFLQSMGTDYLSSIARNDAQTNFGNYAASRRGPFQVQY